MSPPGSELGPNWDMNRYTVSYAAGFFDGEGSVVLKADGALTISATQKDPRPLRLLEHLFGGSIGYIERSKCRPYSYWQVRGEEASAALQRMLPFLIVKRDQAELAIEHRQLYWRGRKGSRTNEQLDIDNRFVDEMRRLNGRANVS